MCNQPMVSIAMCTYNGSSFLEEQLVSVRNQTYRALEIVVVDDASTDSTLEILNRHQREDNRIKVYINKENLGYVKNFENAINLCNGEYIALADQDDIWDFDKITQQIQHIDNYALIYHNSDFIDESGQSLNKSMSDIFWMYQGDNPLPLLFYNCVSGHSILFRKELRENFGNFDKRFHHDWWIAFVASERGGIKYLNKALVKYRQHTLSFTDILKLKNIITNKGGSNLMIEWLRLCGLKSEKSGEFIRRLADIYVSDTSFKHLKIFALLYIHRTLILYVKKKSRWSKLNSLRKISFSMNS